MRTVTFGREVLTTQVKFERNNKIKVEITDEVRDGESIDAALDRVREMVDRRVAAEILAISDNTERVKIDQQRSRRTAMAKAVIRDYGLSIVDFENI